MKRRRKGKNKQRNFVITLLLVPSPPLRSTAYTRRPLWCCSAAIHWACAGPGHSHLAAAFHHSTQPAFWRLATLREVSSMW